MWIGAPSPSPRSASRLYTGVVLALELSSDVIESRVENCHLVSSVTDLEDRCFVWGYGEQIMDIIDKVLDQH